MPAANDLRYRTLRFDEFRTKQNRADALAVSHRAAATARGDGQTLGVWIPLIGASINTVTVASMWQAEPSAIDPDLGSDKTSIADMRSRIFDVLARGQTPCDPSRPGVYTHRWFVVNPENVQLLTDSSVEAWTSMETDTPARISGFWRSRQAGLNGEATILMIVYYPDLTAWEASRFWKPLPQGIDQPNRQVWGEIFRKRREITLDSWVTVHRLV